MRATIDKAGRLVIPKILRDTLGIGPGPVEIHAHGTGLRVEPIVEDDSLVEHNGRLVIPSSGAVVSEDAVRALRDELQQR